MLQIKKINRRIYNIDYSNFMAVPQDDKGTELVTVAGISEFKNSLKKMETTEEGTIVVTPSECEDGVFFRSIEGTKVIYSSPLYAPDTIGWNFNVQGLKKDKFYKITVLAKTTGYDESITDNRKLLITNESQEILINEDLTDVTDFGTFVGIHRATSNEAHIFFTIGKVYIADIIIDEVELLGDDNIEEQNLNIIHGEGTDSVMSYGLFTFTNTGDGTSGRYIINDRLTGEGINLYYDKLQEEFILERDNSENSLTSSFNILSNYVEINLNNLVCNGFIVTSEISHERSPNTLKAGYIRFKIMNYQGENITNNTNINGRVVIKIRKL